MKKILFLCVLLLATKGQAQTLPANEKNLDQMLVNIDKTTVTSGVIYNRVAPFANLYSFNTNSTRNTADFKLFKQALLELYLSSNKTQFTSVENLKTNLNPILYTANSVNMGILNSSFQMLNYNEANPSLGRLQFNETTLLFYDSGNTAQPLFNTSQTTVIAPLKDAVSGSVVTFNWNTIFDFENQLNTSKKIKTLTVDYGTGTVYTIISNTVLTNSTQQITYSSTGEKQITFVVTYADNSTLTTYAKINYIKTNDITGKMAISSNCGNEYGLIDLNFGLISEYEFQGYDESFAFKGFINYDVFYRNTAITKKIVKPIIFIDGFDPGDKRKILPCEYTDEKYDGKSLSDLMKYGVNKENDLIKVLQTKGYDVIIVNQPTYAVMSTAPYDKVDRGTPGSKEIDGGGDYIERNGLNLVTLIKKINAELQANGSTEKLVIVGPSMGGQISRYALAWMEKMNINHNTRLWVSVDSPNLGANIPLGTQAEINLLKDGNDDAKDFYDKSLGSPAAKQQLIEFHGESDSYHTVNQSLLNGRTISQGYSTNAGSSFFQRFYNAQFSNGLSNSKGYPMNLRKIAMTNGSLTGVKTGSDSQQTMNIRGFMDICFPVCFKVHAASMEIFTMPSVGNTSTIARFKKSFDDKTTIATNINSRGNMDIVPGGLFNSYEQIHNSIMAQSGDKTYFAIPFHVDLSAKDINLESRVNTKIHAFIPTFSALAIKYPEQDWSNPLNRNLVCTGETPFDSFYGEDQNTEHTSFNGKSIAFLFKELGDNTTAPSPQVPSFPMQNSLIISGVNSFQVNTNLTVTLKNDCTIAGAPTWSVNNNLQIISTQLLGGNYLLEVKGIVSGAGSGMGTGTITATFGNGLTISKTVYITLPPNEESSWSCQDNSVPSDYNVAITHPLASTVVSTDKYTVLARPNTNIVVLKVPKTSLDSNRQLTTNINTTIPVPTSLTCLGPIVTPPTPIVYYIVYPNPTNGSSTCTVALKSQSIIPTTNPTGIYLYDQMGNVRSQSYFNGVSGTLSVSGLPVGVYFVKVVGQNFLESTAIYVR